MNDAITYTLALPLAGYYIAKRKPKTCPTPLADPVLLTASLLLATQIGLQYTETIAGVLSAGKEATKKSAQTAILLFTIIYATHTTPWYIPLALTTVTIRWHCHIKRHSALLPAVVLAPISIPSAILYAAAHTITKKIKPTPRTALPAMLAVLTALHAKGQPYTLPALAIALGTFPNIRIEKEKIIHTRQIYV